MKHLKFLKHSNVIYSMLFFMVFDSLFSLLDMPYLSIVELLVLWLKAYGIQNHAESSL